jgi:type IX secretion system substrate protein/nidogen-like
MSLEGSGGPDTFGYEWIDSDEPNGPAYVWNDISTSGTAVASWTSTGTFAGTDEGYAGPFSIGFPFKFYGDVKNDVYVSSNGIVMFGTLSSNVFTNGTIPNSAVPNDMIAPFWDDLDGSSQGDVYYQQDGDKFIIQFDNWPKYNTSSGLTFQVVLYSSGKILVYYENMTATLSSCTVGIENGTGTDALQVVYNATYVKNGLALQFAAEPDWLSADGISGRLYNANTVGLELTFSSEDYPLGNYSMDVVISSNDPVTPSVTVPVTMEIVPIPVELTSFNANTFSKVVELVWNTATETNNQGFDIERKLDNDSDWKKIGFQEGKINSSERSVYNFEDSFESIAYKGKAMYRLRQIDLDGSVNYSKNIEVDVDFTPSVYALEQNYPNPFNPATTIKYTLPTQSSVKLSVYNMLGEVVTELVDQVQETGYYEIQWDASNLSSGMYIYTLEAQSVEDQNDFRSLKKMLLVK